MYNNQRCCGGCCRSETAIILCSPIPDLFVTIFVAYTNRTIERFCKLTIFFFSFLFFFPCKHDVDASFLFFCLISCDMPFKVARASKGELVSSQLRNGGAASSARNLKQYRSGQATCLTKLSFPRIRVSRGTTSYGHQLP